MSFVKVMIHAVWGTKNRNRILEKEKRQILFEHIKTKSRDKEIFIKTINGHLDHIHILFGLNAELSLSKTIQLIKGESSFWANKQKLILPKLEWAEGYYAVSVSESIVPKVVAYINNQEEHHKKISFNEECDLFPKKYNFTHAGKE